MSFIVPPRKRKRSVDEQSIKSNRSNDHKRFHIADDGGNDSDEDEEEEEEVWDASGCQWSTKDEAFPGVPAYNQNFLAAQKTLSDLFSTFPDVSSYVQFDETLGQLKDLLQELAGDFNPPPIKIALLGNAGQGIFVPFYDMVHC